MKQLFMLALAGTMFLTACSDDTTTAPPSNTDVYVPSKTGSYVIHTNTVTDSTGTMNAGEDSTVVIGTASMTDGANMTKTAIRHEVFMNGVAVDTMDVAQEGSKVYLNFPLEVDGIDAIEIPALGTRWILVGDANGSTWTALSLDTSVVLDYKGASIPAAVSFVVTGKKIGTEDLTVDGKTVSTIHYQNQFNITISVAALSLSIPIELTQDVWLGKNVGIVKQVQPLEEVSAPAFGIHFEIEGSSSTAIRFAGQ